MHLIGTAVLFGIISGPMAILAAPILGIFGWFIALPEAMMLGLMRLFHDPPVSRKFLWFQGFCWVLVCGILASILIPKEKNSEVLFYVAGFLAGAGAGVFAFTMTHIQKRLEQKYRANPRTSGPLS